MPFVVKRDRDNIPYIELRVRREPCGDVLTLVWLSEDIGYKMYREIGNGWVEQPYLMLSEVEVATIEGRFTEILRRLAFHHPQPGVIEPVMPTTPGVPFFLKNSGMFVIPLVKKEPLDHHCGCVVVCFMEAGVLCYGVMLLVNTFWHFMHFDEVCLDEEDKAYIEKNKLAFIALLSIKPEV